MNMATSGALAPILTPHGHLLLAAERDAPVLARELHARLVNAFARSAGHGLLHLGAAGVGSALPPAFAWWRDFGACYVTVQLTGGHLAMLTCCSRHKTVTQAVES